MLSERFGISSQNSKRLWRLLKYCLLTGWFVSLSCLASTNEDLSVPPAPLASEALPRQQVSAPQKTTLPPKAPEARPPATVPRVVTTQPVESRAPAATVATSALGHAASVTTSQTPSASTPQLKAGETQVPTIETAATKNDSVSLKIMAARAEAVLAELQQESDAMQIAVPFAPSMTSEAGFQQFMANPAMHEVVTPDPAVREDQREGMDGMDWQRIRAQLAGHEGDRRYEKSIVRDAAFDDGPSLYEGDLRLPPMD